LEKKVSTLKSLTPKKTALVVEDEWINIAKEYKKMPYINITINIELLQWIPKIWKK
jgi:hypothetical protein